MGEKHLTDEPRRSGVGEIAEGGAEATVKENQLATVVTGASASHTVPVCHHSDFLSTVRLVQEFEVVPGGTGEARVALSMGGRLDGYLRSEDKGSAQLLRADAVLSPVDGGPVLDLAFPPGHVSGDCVLRCEGECRSPTLVAQAGRYVLVVTLVIRTTADGLFRGHAEAVFAPGRREGTWRSEKENQAPDLEEGEDFGLAVTVRADVPPPG